MTLLQPELLNETPDTNRGAPTPYDQPWLSSLLRPLLIAVMIGCLDITFLSLLARFIPGLAGAYMQLVILLGILAALTGCITTTWLAQPSRRHLRTSAYRLAEFALVLMITRLLVWVALGRWPGGELLIYRPFEALLDGPFIAAGIAVGLSWMLGSEMTANLLRLALQPDELYALQIGRIGEMVRSSYSDRPAILQGLVGRWVGGGILLVLFAAGLQIERPNNGFFAIARQGMNPTVVAAILIYFLAGLLLISYGQLAILRSRWTIEKIPSSQSVLQQWPLYVIGLLLAVALIAMLMPFGGTFWLAQILVTIISAIHNFALGFLQLLMALFIWLITLITGEAPPEAPLPPAPAPMPTVEPMPPAGSALPAWAGGALFWIVMALFLGYAALIYFREKGVTFAWLRALWEMLRTRWVQLFGAYRTWQITRWRPAPTPGEEATEATSLLSRWRQWQTLNPNQRVRYFYLSILAQAEEQGIPRRESETPILYAPRLAQDLQRRAIEPNNTQPGAPTALPPPVVQPRQDTPLENTSIPALIEEAPAEKDVQKLTAAFLKVRYAKGAIDETEISDLEQVWNKLKAYLHL